MNGEPDLRDRPPARKPPATRSSPADEGAVVSDSDSLADDSSARASEPAGGDDLSVDDLEFMSGFLQGALEADVPFVDSRLFDAVPAAAC